MFSQWLITAQAVLSVFLVIGLGAIVRKAGLLNAKADKSLLRLLINVLMPCLIFHNVVSSTAFDDPRNIFFPPVVGLLSVTIGIIIAAAFVRLPRRITGIGDPRAKGTFAACVGIFNYAFIPILLVERLWPTVIDAQSSITPEMVESGRRTLSVLFIHNQGVELAIWTVGVLVISGQLGKSWWRQVLNAPCITILLALSINLLGLAPMIPDFIRSAVERIGQAAIPMSLLLIGATIADQLLLSPVSNGKADTAKKALWSCLIRLGLLPSLFIAVAVFLPCSIELKRVIVIQAAMPSAIFPIVMSRHYNGDPSTALQVVLSTSIVSLITISLWIVVGLHLIGDRIVF